MRAAMDRRGRAGRTHWQAALAALALVAVVLKVLVPAGFMVQAGAGGGVPLVICTGQGEVTVKTVGLDGREQPPAAPAPHDKPCAFAGTGLAAEPPSLAEVKPAEFAAYLAPAAAQPRDLAPGRGLAAPPLPARGPPLTV